MSALLVGLSFAIGLGVAVLHDAWLDARAARGGGEREEPFALWPAQERAAYVIGCYGHQATTATVALEVGMPAPVARFYLRAAQREGLTARLPGDRWRLTRKARRLWA